MHNIKIQLTISLIFIVLICFGTLFPSSSSFVNSQIAPKVYSFIFCSAAILIILAVYSLVSDGSKKLQLNALILPVCITITTLITFQAIYGIAQFKRLLPAFGIYRVTGSFDNPAGFAACLCAGFPFFFYFLAEKERWKRSVSILCMLVVGFSVSLSGSRAGLFSLAVVCILGFFHLFKINGKQKILVGVFLAILLTGLYFMKKDSADGRLLIWRCSWEMIKDKPLTGHGMGGFKANYMNYQAKYFEKHPDSKQALLADNISRPFNEYIGLLVNHGLLGFLLLILLLFYLVKTFWQNTGKTLFTCIAFWCLTAIAVFALFSYPLRYPFVWVAGLLSCSVILFQGKDWHILIRKLTFPILVFSLTPIICIDSYSRLRAEMKWCAVAHKSLAGQTEQMLPEYKSLHNKLFNNELFLYNYAAELNFSKHYEESQSIANECERLWADYDLQMLIADNCQQLKNYTEAEMHYWKAAAMCPVKFSPLYGLAKMYDAIGRKNEAITVAEQIINKSIKITSPTVIAIQREMRQLIEEERNNKLQNENTRQGETPDLQQSGIALPP